jgi:hypothetical protein
VPDRQRKENRQTRFDQYGEGHPYTCLPDISGFEYLTQWLSEAGVAPGGSALTWAEIESYDRSTGGACTLWDRQAISRMSREYASWLAKGGRQSDIADNVPYIERNESTLKAMQDRLSESRDKSAELAKKAKN